MSEILNSEFGVFTYPSKLDGEFCDKVISLASSEFKEATIQMTPLAKK